MAMKYEQDNNIIKDCILEQLLGDNVLARKGKSKWFFVLRKSLFPYIIIIYR